MAIMRVKINMALLIVMMLASFSILASQQKTSNKPSALTLKIMNKTDKLIKPEVLESNNVVSLKSLKPIPANQSETITISLKDYSEMMYFTIKINKFTKLGLATWSKLENSHSVCKNGVIYTYNESIKRQYPMLLSSNQEWNTCEPKKITVTLKHNSDSQF